MLNPTPRSSRRTLLWVIGSALAVAAAVYVWLATPPPRKALPPPVKSAPPPRARLTGSELVKRYAEQEKSPDHVRHLLVLEQVAQHNMPDSWDDWVTVTARGRKGTVVEFDVSPHGLRIGTNEDWIELPLDGPHAAAAAEVLGARLATAWMVEQVDAASSKSRVVHYYAATQIALSLGYSDWNPDLPDGVKMRSTEFFRQRTSLLREWLRKNQVGDSVLVGGYFKSVVPPIDGITRRGGLEMVGGRNDAGGVVQPLSAGFHEREYYDYSHNLRLAKDRLRVDGRPMTMEEFCGSVPYAIEFGFQRSRVPTPAYPYPEKLAEWMQRREREKGRVSLR